MKGISLCTFTSEEIQELQETGGNDVFTRTYCATLPAGYVKPDSSSLDLVRDWIEDVYILKKFYKSSNDSPAKETEGRLRLDISADVAIVPLSDLLGANTPILEVSLKKFENGSEEISHDHVDGDSTCTLNQAVQEPKASNLLGDWDPFGLGEAPPPLKKEADQVGNQTASETLPIERKETSSNKSFEEEWESFISLQDGTSVEDVETALSVQKDNEASSEIPTRASAAAVPMQNKEENDTVPLEKSSNTEILPQRGLEPAPEKAKPFAIQEEIPLEAFYPEFEQIRATGMLPTGKPVPWQMRTLNTADSGHNVAEGTTVLPRQPHSNMPVVEAEKPRRQEPARAIPDPTENAVKALFGRERNITAYDMTAPSAPKSAVSGNPFA